ncbi:putative T7SS-secreted protein [Saccharomonospora saliphila]|uniref:putative T7SS-secreted protein n=1 Tax=Saccharomonospora saliphila TaxID=369829 RepID=UPI0003717B9F|nr:hypothetical protein [Saccharomonospora saliphila]
MVLQLGQTTNPRDLIPGDPETITADLRGMVDTMGGVGDIGSLLGGIDPAQWVGEASNAFRDAFGAEPPKWGRIVDTISQGGQTLSDYADLLNWGQGEAQRAIELHTQALAASRAALAQFRAVRAGGGDPGEFSDPGEAGMREAQSILDNARQRIEGFGAEIAGKLGFEPDGEGGYSRGGELEGSWEGTREGEWGSRGTLAENPVATLLDTLGIELPSLEGEASADVSVAEGEVDGSFDEGWVSGEGRAGGAVLGAGAQAQGEVDAMGARGEASAEAYLARGEAEGGLDFLDGNLGLDGAVEGMVGAEASADGQLGWTGGEGSVEAFAGGRIAGEGTLDLPGVDVGVNGEGWAGAGAEADVQFGMGDDGKFHIGAGAGAAWGLGGKVGYDVAIDPGEIASGASGLASDVGNATRGMLGF